MKERLTEIVAPLLDWYHESKRDLPWRRDKDPYHIWVSEIMLQQTRASAVIPYYERFLECLPDVKALSEVSEDKLLKLWEGLGYYNRVRNMQKAAIQIMEDYGGNFPQTSKDIEKLKGIGSYTAGAISSIAFEEKSPAVDGNVLRVLSRLLAYDKDIAKQSTKTEVEDMVRGIIPDTAGDFNQSLIELGALVCVPNGEPKCEECPLGAFCRARAEGRVNELPVKSKLKPRKIEPRTILIYKDGQHIAIQKRPSRGLLAGLYEYPSLDGHKTQDEVVEYSKEIGLMPVHIKELARAKHIFSHIEWHMIGYEILVDELEKTNNKNFLFIDPEEIEREYPIPSAFEKYSPHR